MDFARVRALSAGGFGLALGVALTVTLGAQADGESDNIRTLPYSGYVDFDGQPVNAGAVKFNFALFPCATPGSGAGQCAPLWVASGAWSNGFPAASGLSLPIFSGRFSVELGAVGQAPLPDAVFEDGHEVLWLAIQIEGKTLANLQKLTPTFRAISAGETDRLRVRSEVAFDDAAGGSARLRADDGLVVGHTAAGQTRLLAVGEGVTPAMVVHTGGAVVNGALAADEVLAGTLTVSGDASVEGALTGPSGALAVRGQVQPDDVIASGRAGLVFDLDDRLDAFVEGNIGYATDLVSSHRPVLSLNGGYLAFQTTQREAFRPRNAWTFMTWFKSSSTSPTGNQVIMSQYECSDNYTLVRIGADKKASFFFRRADPTTVLLTAETVLDLSQWHHVAATRDASGTLRLYVDGVLGATGAVQVTGAFTQDIRFLLGSIYYCDNTQDPFRGGLDGARFYQRELSAAEIAAFVAATRERHL